MILKEMKKKVFSLIEELETSKLYLTTDDDLQKKINNVINQIQFELARIKKIPAKLSISVLANQEINLNDLVDLDNFYQLKIIRGINLEGDNIEYEVIDNLVKFLAAGNIDIYYYKYPQRIVVEKIESETEEQASARVDSEYVFELSDDVLEIMPYGVAGDILKSDISVNYGKEYSNRYNELISRLDPRINMPIISFSGGFNL